MFIYQFSRHLQIHIKISDGGLMPPSLAWVANRIAINMMSELKKIEPCNLKFLQAVTLKDS